MPTFLDCELDELPDWSEISEVIGEFDYGTGSTYRSSLGGAPPTGNIVYDDYALLKDYLMEEVDSTSSVVTASTQSSRRRVAFVKSVGPTRQPRRYKGLRKASAAGEKAYTVQFMQDNPRARAPPLELGLQPDGLRPNGLQPSGLQPSGLQPSGLQPSGLQPSGQQPDGLRPNGLQPSGLRPSGLQPSGLQPSGLQPSGLQPSGVQSQPVQTDGSSGLYRPDNGQHGGPMRSSQLNLMQRKVMMQHAQAAEESQKSPKGRIYDMRGFPVAEGSLIDARRLAQAGSGVAFLSHTRGLSANYMKTEATALDVRPGSSPLEPVRGLSRTEPGPFPSMSQPISISDNHAQNMGPLQPITNIQRVTHYDPPNSRPSVSRPSAADADRRDMDFRYLGTLQAPNLQNVSNMVRSQARDMSKENQTTGPRTMNHMERSLGERTVTNLGGLPNHLEAGAPGSRMPLGVISLGGMPHGVGVHYFPEKLLEVPKETSGPVGVSSGGDSPELLSRRDGFPTEKPVAESSSQQRRILRTKLRQSDFARK